MNPEEIHRLVEEYRDGTLSAADARLLAETIRRDAAVAETVHRELAFSGHLGQAVDGADDEAFARSFAERLQAERGGSEFVRAFEKRSSSRLGARTRRVASPRSSAVPFLVAAALALAVVGLVLYTAKQPPVKSVAVQTAPTPPPPEEPKIAPEPPVPTPVPPVRKPEELKTVAPPPVAPVPPAKPEPPPAPVPVPPVEGPKPAPTRTTEVAPSTAVAKIDRVEGEVFVVVEGERKPAHVGQSLPPGVGVSTGLAKSGASLVLSDGTRFSLGADAGVREIAKGPRGTRVALTVGTLVADVAKQPADQPLVFATPHGEARVLGTVLRLVVDSTLTRLEVKEGKVRLTRDGKSVDVGAGQFAVAGAGMSLAARSVSPDEIVLYPQDAKVTGAEWSLQRDPKALMGVVLEAGTTAFKVTDHVQTRPSYATYTFFAPADKEYRLWMRLTSQEKGDPWTRDMVTIEPTRATMNQKSPFFGAAPTTAWVVTGLSTTAGYTWISATGEAGRVEPPLVVKFQETGLQTVRLYVGQPWARVDAIWFSATQKTRPPAKQLPPLSEK